MKNNKIVIIALSDLVAVFASFFISLRLGYLTDFNPFIYQTHLGPFTVIYAVWFFILFAFGLYEVENIRPTIRSIKNVAGAFILAFVISLTLFYLIPSFGISPKTNLLINIVIFAILFTFQRRAITSLFSKKYKERILLVGKCPEIDELKEKISKNIHGLYEVVAEVDELDAETWERIKMGHFDLVIMSDYEISQELLNQDIDFILSSETKFVDCIKAYEKILTKIPSEKINEMWFLESISTFRGKVYETIKRFVETIISGIFLIIISPLLLLVLIFIKLEDGGKFMYSQTRVGKNGKEFLIYKIRSMIEDSEKDGPKWADEKDSRVTKIGKIVRATHLDESLQLVNVIKGEVSIIGPRPERPVFVEELSSKIKNYNLRHVVKPGITGWAQLYYKYGNTVEDAKQKFEYDLFYIKNRSITMDIGILIRTLQKIFI